MDKRNSATCPRFLVMGGMMLGQDYTLREQPVRGADLRKDMAIIMMEQRTALWQSLKSLGQSQERI